MLTRDQARDLFAQRAGVSRETLSRFDALEALLLKWTQTINLIGRGDRDRLWSRHFLDSAGLYTAAVDSDQTAAAKFWIDLGSGGGFPLLPLAILAEADGRAIDFVAVESDHRKAAFLRTAAAALGLALAIETRRIETYRTDRRCVVSARALAPLGDLLALARAAAPNALELLLLKGSGVDRELTDAARRWHMRYRLQRNPLTLEGAVLTVQGYHRVHGS